MEQQLAREEMNQQNQNPFIPLPLSQDEPCAYLNARLFFNQKIIAPTKTSPAVSD
jgi:hypothetical protein